MNVSLPIAVLGAGSWGTALAMHLARSGHQVNLWEYDHDQVLAMQRDCSNEKYAAGFSFPDSIFVTHSLSEAIENVQDILIVVPSFAFRPLLETLKPLLKSTHRIVWATKGIDPKTNQLFHEVVRDVLGDFPMAVLSGPSFAEEVLKNLPTAITLACSDEDFMQSLVNYFNRGVFRVYTTDDLIGVQLGGAVKNVIAIATGICDGLSLGANARNALITRGLAELTRLGIAMGAKQATFMGLSGMGDMMLTCSENLSRNRRLGLALAAGKTLKQFEEELGQVVEGVHAVKQVLFLANKYHVEMPICQRVYAILYEHASSQDMLKALLTREPKAEAE